MARLTRVVTVGAIHLPARDLLGLLVFSFIDMLSTSAPDIGIHLIKEVAMPLVSLQDAPGMVPSGLVGDVRGNRMHRWVKLFQDSADPQQPLIRRAVDVLMLSA